MGRTACTEPQCLYKGDLYLFYLFLAHVILFIGFYLSMSVAGVKDVCIKSGLPMVVSYISDTLK